MQKSIRKFGARFWILPVLASSLSWVNAQPTTLDIQLWDSGTKTGEWKPLLIDMGNGGYMVNNVNYSSAGANLYFHDMTMSADPFISASVDVDNTTLSVQNYTLIFTLPISPAITAGSRIGGSTQGGLTDANNDGIGTLSTVGPGTALYNGQIDGVNVLPLYPHLSTLSVPFAGGSASESTSAGLPGPTIPGPNALTSIGIMHQFSLTPGDRATFTSFFTVQPTSVPEPAALSLLAIGGVTMALRRRR